MILFYSVHCKHCAMLLDSVRRLDVNGAVKQVNIESLKHTHPNLFQQLQAVPALMTLPSKDILYGKAVFDYLLLPTRGKLVSSGGTPQQAANTANGGTLVAQGESVGILHIEEGVMAFNGMSNKGLYSDSFADINETEATPSDPANNPHSAFNWISIDEMMRLGAEPTESKATSPAVGISSAAATTGMGLETRAPKESLDVDSIRRERDKDLQSLYAGQTMPI